MNNRSPVQGSSTTLLDDLPTPPRETRRRSSLGAQARRASLPKSRMSMDTYQAPTLSPPSPVENSTSIQETADTSQTSPRRSSTNQPPDRAFRKRLEVFYAEKKPAMLPMIPKLVEKFKGREEAYYTALVKKYGALGQPIKGSPALQLDASSGGRRAAESRTSPVTSDRPTAEDTATPARNDWTTSILGCFSCGGYDGDSEPTDFPPDRIRGSNNADFRGGSSNNRKLQQLEQQLTEARIAAERLSKITSEFEKRLAEAAQREAQAVTVAKETAEEMERLKEASIMRDVEIAGLFQARSQNESALQKVMDEVQDLREQVIGLPPGSGNRGFEDSLAATESSMRALETQLGNISAAVGRQNQAAHATGEGSNRSSPKVPGMPEGHLKIASGVV